MMSAIGTQPAAAAAEMSAPCLVLDIDIAEKVPVLPPPGLGGARCAWVLVRFESRPLGTVIVEIPRLGMSSSTLSEILKHELNFEIDESQRVASVTADAEPDDSPPVSELEIAVVICTRERPDGLKRCLESLFEQSYRPFHVVVVDNAPASDASAAIVSAFNDERVTYVVEPTPDYRGRAIGAFRQRAPR